ncbi:hypothetical protein JKP88DRAFT_304221 [Tribonema minus]|uniref:C3H1-type domain-containing protein n=1 Tax=Tribonema minus TaxID=303371 RepID=A0A835Z6B5_9STRA|nr:hypothetical protein JKP88DRAFT_304221 [Tribonema minus]
MADFTAGGLEPLSLPPPATQAMCGEAPNEGLASRCGCGYQQINMRLGGACPGCTDAAPDAAAYPAHAPAHASSSYGSYNSSGGGSSYLTSHRSGSGGGGSGGGGYGGSYGSGGGGGGPFMRRTRRGSDDYDARNADYHQRQYLSRSYASEPGFMHASPPPRRMSLGAMGAGAGGGMPGGGPPRSLSASSITGGGGTGRGTNRRALQHLRVIQRNLVYVIGLSPSISAGEAAAAPYFGQYGRIAKVTRRPVASVLRARWCGLQRAACEACRADDLLLLLLRVRASAVLIVVNHHHGVSEDDPRHGSASAYVTFVYKDARMRHLQVPGELSGVTGLSAVAGRADALARGCGLADAFHTAMLGSSQPQGRVHAEDAWSAIKAIDGLWLEERHEGAWSAIKAVDGFWLASSEDAWSAIKAVDGFWLEGRHVRASFGTTKYCNSFLRGLACNNGDCLYLHELGDERDRFTKEEIQAGLARHGSSFAFRDEFRGSGGAFDRPSGTGLRAACPVLPPPAPWMGSPPVTPLRGGGAMMDGGGGGYALQRGPGAPPPPRVAGWSPRTVAAAGVPPTPLQGAALLPQDVFVAQQAEAAHLAAARLQAAAAHAGPPGAAAARNGPPLQLLDASVSASHGGARPLAPCSPTASAFMYRSAIAGATLAAAVLTALCAVLAAPGGHDASAAQQLAADLARVQLGDGSGGGGGGDHALRHTRSLPSLPRHLAATIPEDHSSSGGGGGGGGGGGDVDGALSSSDEQQQQQRRQQRTSQSAPDGAALSLGDMAAIAFGKAATAAAAAGNSPPSDPLSGLSAIWSTPTDMATSSPRTPATGPPSRGASGATASPSQGPLSTSIGAPSLLGLGAGAWPASEMEQQQQYRQQQQQRAAAAGAPRADASPQFSAYDPGSGGGGGSSGGSPWTGGTAPIGVGGAAGAQQQYWGSGAPPPPQLTSHRSDNHLRSRSWCGDEDPRGGLPPPHPNSISHRAMSFSYSALPPTPTSGGGGGYAPQRQHSGGSPFGGRGGAYGEQSPVGKQQQQQYQQQKQQGYGYGYGYGYAPQGAQSASPHNSGGGGGGAHFGHSAYGVPPPQNFQQSLADADSTDIYAQQMQQQQQQQRRGSGFEQAPPGFAMSGSGNSLQEHVAEFAGGDGSDQQSERHDSPYKQSSGFESSGGASGGGADLAGAQQAANRFGASFEQAPPPPFAGGGSGGSGSTDDSSGGSRSSSSAAPPQPLTFSGGSSGGGADMRGKSPLGFAPYSNPERAASPGSANDAWAFAKGGGSGGGGVSVQQQQQQALAGLEAGSAHERFGDGGGADSEWRQRPAELQA